MFRPVALFIGLRYTRTRKRSLLLSFVSLMSMLGITLGVMVMILVLSVINGSTTVMRNETLKSVPHVTLTAPGGLDDWQALVALAETHPRVLAAAPLIAGEAWLRYQGQDRFVRVRGVDPQREQQLLDPGPASVIQGLEGQTNGLIMGLRLAGALGLYADQSLTLTPLRSLLSRALDDQQGFVVAGSADFGFYGNGDLVLMDLQAAQSLFAAMPGAGVQVRLRVDDVFAAAEIAADIAARMPQQPLQIEPWMEAQRSLFDALRMEKVLTGFMLLMIVLIGAVNIVSTLVMVVADKGADIAILRTMGAGKGTVMAVFMVQGCVAGLFGTAAGALLGVGLTRYLQPVSEAFENLLNRWVAPDSVYVISYLRADLLWSDVSTICLAALGISVLATLYPAWRAAKVQPAEVLRYE